MANLEFCEKHNMVAFLKKPPGSEGFQEIVDFLNGSHIRYALTKNPTIYVSLIKQFWQTATVRAVDNGEQQIIATVNGKEFTITEASVRRHLQLSDANGEQTPLFPTMMAIQAEEGEGSGHPSEPQPPPSSAQHIHKEQILTIVSSTHQKTQTSRQALNKDIELPQTSVPIPNVLDKAVYEEWDDSVERATTTAASLDVAQDSGNILKTQSTAMPNVPLPQGIDKVLALKTNLRQTKKVYGTAYTKLIMKVKKLEKTVKSNEARRRTKIVVSDDEEDSEDSSKQGRMMKDIDQDTGITLVTPKKDAAKKKINTYTKRRRAVSTGSEGVSTASKIFSTAEESVSTANVVQEGVKDKGKATMQESKQPKKIKKRVQIQMSLDEELAQKLYEEEQARFNVEQEAKFNTEQEELLASETTKDEANPSVTNVDRDDVQAQIQADEELAQKMLEEERESFAKETMASSSMKTSSSHSIKTYSNEFSGKRMAVSRPGWKTCRSCQKEFHCGYSASSLSYDEINNEIECRGCMSHHANLNHSEETNDDTTITPSPRANGDTTITLTPRIHDDTITPTLRANVNTTITPTHRANCHTITLTPRAIDDTTITSTPHAIDDTTITPTPCVIDEATITPTPRANDDTNITPTPCPIDYIIITPIVPYHYIPRMTDLQFEEIKRGRVGENSQIVMGFREEGIQDRPEEPKVKLVPLFEKMVCQDTEGEDWKFTLNSWTKNEGRMYFLDEFYVYAQVIELSLGDTVTFSRLDPEGKLIIGYRKNSSESSSNHMPRAAIASTSRVRDTRGIVKSYNKSAAKVGKKLAMVSKVTKGKPPSSASQPPSGSKHSSTCLCRACVAKRLRVKNMTEKASQKPHIQQKRKVPEPAEPSKQQIIRVSRGSEENRHPQPSLQTNKPSQSVAAQKKIKMKEQNHHTSSKRTKTRNREPEPQAIVEARIAPQPSNVTKKHTRHRTGCQCIICIQPPSGSKHSSTCPCRACVAKRLRVKNMTEKASQKPHIRQKRKVPEPAEPSKQQIIRVSRGSEENRHPQPSLQTNKPSQSVAAQKKIKMKEQNHHSIK
uniref:VAL1-3 N-terminal zinc finger domain-containing protein n=1 Tax=Tanacetum cinerariifolium TaxID=118510 RepID=A0A6L2KZQ9_TANCI|nr:hypothetical protein [Tanacetum cinerariifolium]